MGVGRRTGRWGSVALSLVVLVSVVGCGSGEQTIRARPRALDLHLGSPGRSSLPVAAARGPLAVGSYFTSRFKPGFRFEVPAGWKLNIEAPGFVYLSSGTVPGDFLEIYVLSPGHADPFVADPPLATDDFATGRAAFPGDYIAYLVASPYLEASVPQPSTLLGLHGTTVDAVVSDTPAEGVCQGLPGACFALFSYANNYNTLQVERPGVALRAWSLERGNQRLIVIGTANNAAQLAARTDGLDAVLGTIKFL